VGGIALGFVLLIQLLYPAGRLLPFVQIDGMSLGGVDRSEAASKLNTAYANHKINIYMGKSSKPVVSSKLSSADIKVDNTARLEKLDYPWYLRLLPTSILWAGSKSTSTPVPTYGSSFDSYAEKHLMPSCRQDPIDATLKAQGDRLVMVSAKKGGQCEAGDVIKSVKSARPTIQKQTEIRVDRKEIEARIKDEVAKKLAETLNSRLSKGINLGVGNESVAIPVNEVVSWLDFSSSNDKIIATVNTERSAKWLNSVVAYRVAIKPGVSHITTNDFTVVSQTTGENGRAIDIAETVKSLQSVVNGQAASATVITKVVPPTEQYTRTYSASDTGLSALMANYAKDHYGVFGISMIELDGKKRRADYRGNEQFVTASTYKLFVAYSLMKQINSGKRDWSSSVTCFNKMISHSDNACAESLLGSIGLKNVTADIQSIGLTNSTFMKEGGPYTTANDLTLLLGMIATRQNFSSENQQRLISAMTGNVFRKGIPAGVGGKVANKVGFMNGLLHDAAIVYGSSGTYVLAIMTDGSSWETIADLAKNIDKLHAL
jgi:hypothetical protein cdivTM_06952